MSENEKLSTTQLENVVDKETNNIDLIEETPTKIDNVSISLSSNDLEPKQTDIKPSVQANNKKAVINNEGDNTKEYRSKLLVTKTKLLESGVQYGHQVQWWNPKMKPFINYTKNGIHIINLHKSIASIQNAYTTVQKLAEANKTILFVGTTRQSKKSIKENAERINAFYINNRWLGGLLTNFKTIKNSIMRLKALDQLQEKSFEGYTKKEGILLKKELEKLNSNLGGIKNIRKTPDAIFVSSTKADKIAILEAKKLGIPVIGIVDTNEDPTLIEVPIFANDDAIKSVSLIVTLMVDAIADQKGLPVLAAFKDADAKILGLDLDYVKPKWKSNRGPGGYNNRNSNSKYQKPYQGNNYRSPKPSESKPQSSDTSSSNNS